MPDRPSAHDPAKLLEHFRASKRRLPLHPLEKAVLVAVCVHLCFLPWALGTMHPWSQITSLVLASIGLTLALIPRLYRGDYLLPIHIGEPTTQNRGPNIHLSSSDRKVSESHPQLSAFSPQPSAMRLSPWPRLLRFPIFWIGLALLGYIVLQALN